MNKRLALITFLLVLLSAGVLLQPSATASMPFDSDYDLSWWTIDGGGAVATGSAGYTLGGTAGQSDAAVWTGGDYTLAVCSVLVAGSVAS